MADSTEVSTLLQQGIAAVKAGRKQDAHTFLMRVVELDDHNELAWLWLSGIIESFEDRRICLENVLEINPDNATAQAGLRWLNDHVPAPPQDHCPHCNAPVPKQGRECPTCKQPLFVICPQCDDYAEISSVNCPHCGHKLGYFREGARYYVVLAEEYLEGQHHALVAEALARAEATPIDDAVILDRIGGLYARIDRQPQAIAAYRQAIACAPNDVTAYLHLGEFYRKHELIEEARTLYEAAAQHIADDATILYELARTKIETEGSTLITLDLLERAVQIEPDHAAAHLMLGNAYTLEHDERSAAQHYTRTIELTEPGTSLNLQARSQMTRIAPNARSRGQGRGEVTRQMIALMISPILGALSNARLMLLQIVPLVWLMLIVAGIGSFLWISATDLPRNSLAEMIFGPEGVPQRRRKTVEALGLILWIMAFGVIVAKV